MDSTLTRRVGALHASADRATQQLDYERQNLVRLAAKMAQIEKDKTQLVLAVGLLDRCIQIISANGIGKIESIVSGGIQMVFDDKNLSLLISKKETARGSSYELLVRHGEVVGKPMDSFGGGVGNVIAFLLRLIMIKRFKLAKFLAVDEAFNNVHPDHGDLARVSEMLKTLADKGFTILAVSGQPVLAAAADNVYKVVPTADGPKLVRVDRLQLGEANGTEEQTDTAQVA